MNLIYNTPKCGFDEVAATNSIRIIPNAKMTSLLELEAVVVAVHKRMYRDASLIVETVTNLFVIAQIASGRRMRCFYRRRNVQWKA